MKILIIGVSGYLGNTIYKKLNEISGINVFGPVVNNIIKDSFRSMF